MTRQPRYEATCTALEPIPPMPITTTVSPGPGTCDADQGVERGCDGIGQHRYRGRVVILAGRG